MCGIAGVISATPINETTLRQRLKAMSAAIRHRGPDGEDLYIAISASHPIGLVHRRLAITDPRPAAAQPMSCLGRYHIVHNGELYNHCELREELQRQGYRFQTASDTEVLAMAWDAWGPSCLDRFDGMFAFALWDGQEQTLWCARDRFGEKPFFFHYKESSRQLSFASEMKALWAAGIQRIPKEAFFLHFLTLGLTAHPELPTLTFWEDILQLPPAHLLQFRPSERSLRLERYWDLDKEGCSDLDIATAVDTIREQLTDSMRLRMRTDAPIGIALSGGLDSSLLAAIGQEARLPSFSAVFPGFAKDESLAITDRAGLFRTTPHHIAPNASGLLEDIRTIAWHQEEPFGSAGIYAQFCVHRLARQQGVKVIIDGQGADEVFAGYPRYSHWYLQEEYASRHFLWAEQAAKRLRGHGFLPAWGWQHRLAAFMPATIASRLESRARHRHLSNTDIAPAFRDRASGAGFIQKPVIRKLNDILYHDACGGPLAELLRYADRNAMSHGLELRLPYLQHKLVASAFSLPSNYKFREGFTKWILRQAFQQPLGEKIAWQPGKTGFEPPQRAWMRAPQVAAAIRKGQTKLVDAGMLSPKVLKRPVQASAAYALDNRDWRYWTASLFL